MPGSRRDRYAASVAAVNGPPHVFMTMGRPGELELCEQPGGVKAESAENSRSRRPGAIAAMSSSSSRIQEIGNKERRRRSVRGCAPRGRRRDDLNRGGGDDIPAFFRDVIYLPRAR